MNPPSPTVPNIINKNGILTRVWFPLDPCPLGTPLLTTREYVPKQKITIISSKGNDIKFWDGRNQQGSSTKLYLEHKGLDAEKLLLTSDFFTGILKVLTLKMLNLDKAAPRKRRNFNWQIETMQMCKLTTKHKTKLIIEIFNLKSIWPKDIVKK